MDRIIEVKVSGGYLSLDGRKAGNQHEANATRLRITFDPSWDGYAKTVTFWDANGLHQVKRILTADRLEDQSKNARVYLCPIPGEAMTESGLMTFTIDGYVNGVRQRTAGANLGVDRSPYTENAADPADPTPSQAEQLQVQIDTMLGDILAKANRAESAAVEAKQYASGAKTSEINAGVSEINAGVSAANAATSAINAGVSETNAATSERAAQAAKEVAEQVKDEVQQTADSLVTIDMMDYMLDNYLPFYVRGQVFAHDDNENAHWRIQDQIHALQYLNEYLWKAPPYRKLVTENYVHVYGSYWSTAGCPEAEIDNLVIVQLCGTGFTFDRDTGLFTLENPAYFQMPYADFVVNGATAMRGRYFAKSLTGSEVRYFTEDSTIEVKETYQGSAPNRMFYAQYATNNVTQYRSLSTGPDAYVTSIDMDKYAGEDGFVLIGKPIDLMVELHTHAGRHASGGADPITPASIGAASADEVRQLAEQVAALAAIVNKT